MAGSRLFPLALLLAGLMLAALVPAGQARADGSYEDGWMAYADGRHAEAARVWTPLAEAGDARAQNALGALHESGRGVPADPAAAAEWFARAEAQDDPAGAYNLGRLHRRGIGVEKDPARTLALWRKAGEAGNPAALSGLGDMALAGEGMSADATAAADWYRKGAEAGYAPAQTALGRLLRDGRGIDRDPKAAASWLRKAAQQAFPPALVALSGLFEKGLGVRQSLMAAHTQLAIAERLGHEQAGQRRLLLAGRLGEKGVEKSLWRAKAWLATRKQMR